jgi:DNA relaxase NicK
MFDFLTEPVADPLISVTRIDLACDDLTGALDMDEIWEYLQNGKYRTHMTTKTFHESFSGDNAGARTAYIGSAASLGRIRIYDKAKQFYDPESEPEQYKSHWLRFEIVLRHEYAEQAAQILANADDIDAAVAGIISSKFNFIEITNENITRCALASWWVAFLEERLDVKLSPKPKNKHIIERHAEWLRYSISRTLSKVYHAMGDVELQELLEHGKEKLTENDLAQIKDFKRKQRGGGSNVR